MVQGTDIVLPLSRSAELILERFRYELPMVEKLSRITAGMYGNEILEAQKSLRTGQVSRRPGFRYRNPVTGRSENEINR